MRISVIQMSPGSDKRENIAQASTLIAAAIGADRPDLVILPEMWTCLGGSRATKFGAAEVLPEQDGNQPGEAYTALQAIARKARIYVHGGSIGERSGDRIRNTSLVFGPDGREIGRYRKIHLFDIVTPNGEGYRESSVYEAGQEVVTLPLGEIHAGLAICYDLRFAELFLSLRRAGADLLILPAAFTMETGEAHWETLLRARAIETQCWVAAAATCGQHMDGGGSLRGTYGHSMIIDPWGTVVARASSGSGWATAILDKSRAGQIRSGIPVLDHRRLA